MVLLLPTRPRGAGGGGGGGGGGRAADEEAATARRWRGGFGGEEFGVGPEEEREGKGALEREEEHGGTNLKVAGSVRFGSVRAVLLDAGRGQVGKEEWWPTTESGKREETSTHYQRGKIRFTTLAAPTINLHGT